MENDTNAAPAADTNATGNTGTDNGSTNAPAAGENNQSQSTDTNGGNAGAGDQGATSQDNSNPSGNTATEEVDYSTLVPTITIEHDKGTVPDPVQDPEGYARFINDDADQRAKFRNSEINGWRQLEREFPEVRTNAELRQNILARRIFDAQNGKDTGLVGAGRSVMSPVSQAHANGKTDAQVGIEEQQRAGVNGGTPPRQDNGNSSDKLTAFRRGDLEAGRSIVEQMLLDKKI